MKKVWLANITVPPHSSPPRPMFSGYKNSQLTLAVHFQLKDRCQVLKAAEIKRNTDTEIKFGYIYIYVVLISYLR